MQNTSKTSFINDNRVPPRDKNITVEEIRPISDKGALKAFCTVNLSGQIRIHSVRIIQQADQRPWVSLPQVEVRAKDGGRSKWYPIVECIDKELLSRISEVVLATYHQMKPQPSVAAPVPEGW